MNLPARLPAAALLLSAVSAFAQPLPRLAASTGDVTVSGISSGGYMAVQFQVAYSSIVRGAGVAGRRAVLLRRGFAAPGAGQLHDALRQGHAADGRRDAEDRQATGRIGPHRSRPKPARRPRLAAGRRQRQDRPAAGDGCARCLLPRHLPAAAISLRQGAGGRARAALGRRPAGECLPHQRIAVHQSLPGLRRRRQAADAPARPAAAAGSAAGRRSGRLRPAPLRCRPGDRRQPRQRAYAFVPASCRSGGCRIHVAFHGCRQNAGEIGRRFVDGAGYNGWAASNRIVVLYPQTVRRYGLAVGSWRWLLNPKGCWDWWGYTGANYHTRDGAQMRAVRAMIEALGLPPQPVQLAPPSTSDNTSR